MKRNTAHPKRPPGQMISEEEQFDVGAVSDKALQGHCVHRRGVRKHDQLQTIKLSQSVQRKE